MSNKSALFDHSHPAFFFEKMWTLKFRIKPWKTLKGYLNKRDWGMNLRLAMNALIKISMKCISETVRGKKKRKIKRNQLIFQNSIHSQNYPEKWSKLTTMCFKLSIKIFKKNNFVILKLLENVKRSVIQLQKCFFV